ncbi:hypothetical protein JRC04_09080 [Mycolicibacterium sp. S2-37]|uniref:hypothetical protein n=1 Tax=Mycolicibacterium sp. S2-37 TaxID=2810297 RepID=UPI001A943176|nr:hypothetical protein [Mycolicibacterium sp. S2-37]MBO0677612.1 hypothetical protein [Mycolicibacterium sp. S2-37]
MNSNYAFTGVGVAGMPRTHRAAAPITIAAAHIAFADPAAAPVERKRRAATAAAATGASVKVGTT